MKSIDAGQPRIRPIAFVCAIILGLIADPLIRVDGRLGLNVLLWALAGAASLWFVSRRRRSPLSRESRWMISGAIAFAALLLFRDAEALAGFCMLSAITLLGFAAGRGALAWATGAYIVDVAASAVRVGGLIAAGPLGWSVGAAREPSLATSTGERARPRHVRMVARGTVMAIPPLLVLTALLTSADPMFERALHNALFDGIEPLLPHLLFVCVVAWFATGYMRAFLVGDDAVMDHVRLPRPALSSSEITVAVSLLNILFLAFLAVQVRYLFGGSGLVEVTPGLSYADYARRGFFELVAAAAFVVPVLLIADWAASRDEAGGRRALRATSTLLVVLLGGVLASAAYRMKLYQDAYGMTEDRLYGSVFMVWLTCVLIWLAVTVLRGQRRGFVFGAVVAGLACVVALHVLNPHALIARVNIRRAIAGAEYDGRYLSTLSGDAVPTLIARLPALPVAERCRVTAMLDKRWNGERPGGWRTWNLGDARARKAVAELQERAECRALTVG